MSIIKLQAPFERLRASVTCGQKALRRGVILQAILDVSNLSKALQTSIHRDSAEKWIFHDSQNFYTTCDEAGLNPNFVRQLAQKMIDISREKLKCSNRQKQSSKSIKKNDITKLRINYNSIRTNIPEKTLNINKNHYDKFYSKNYR